MSENPKLTLYLDDLTVGELKKRAKEQNVTVNQLLVGVLDTWLEERRKNVRLGRLKNRATVYQLLVTGRRSGK
jgi:hypothetical protein